MPAGSTFSASATAVCSATLTSDAINAAKRVANRVKTCAALRTGRL